MWEPKADTGLLRKELEAKWNVSSYDHLKDMIEIECNGFKEANVVDALSHIPQENLEDLYELNTED